jgi:hypothetical protein
MKKEFLKLEQSLVTPYTSYFLQYKVGSENFNLLASSSNSVWYDRLPLTCMNKYQFSYTAFTGIIQDSRHLQQTYRNSSALSGVLRHLERQKWLEEVTEIHNTVCTVTKSSLCLLSQLVISLFHL